MTLSVQSEQTGFGISSPLTNELDILRLIEMLGGVDLPKSRAGIRQVMNQPPVSRIAQSEEALWLVKAIPGEEAVPFVRHC